MGQAWCRERSSKAQDSKSPLDRVFVRCAHRIYPGLKEEGSVLGGATQRVTSSEIGYAGSPPRELLARGRSIDSVDRPFHPSDWVDANLEVPSTPRPGSALTDLTVDTNLYPTTSPTSSCSNLKAATTPVPPPRRRKRNRGRPLPPKPDEIGAEATASGPSEEPLYSSVRSPRSSGDERDVEAEGDASRNRTGQDDGARDQRRAKEIYEHKVNGTGRIVSSDAVSRRRLVEAGHRRRSEERKRSSRDGSREPEKRSGSARTKNRSTVSLPNYDELDGAGHRSRGDEHRRDKGDRSWRAVGSSTGSLPAESLLAPCSEITSGRPEDRVPRSASPSAPQVPAKLEAEADGPGGDRQLGDVGSPRESTPRRRFSFQHRSGTTDEGEASARSSLDRGRKPDSSRKSPSPVLGEPRDARVDSTRSRSKHSGPPAPEESSPGSSGPFFLDEAKHRSALDTRFGESGTTFARSLSNESEPTDDAAETKGLDDARATAAFGTVFEAPGPRQPPEKSSDDRGTSPEPGSEPTVLPDSDRSTLPRLPKEEAGEGSDPSSMTPSLTELEAALSDMLEKEERQDGSREESNLDGSIAEERKPATARKVSFRAGEETGPETRNRLALGEPGPEKPSRLSRSLDEPTGDPDGIPTPPRRKNRSLGANGAGLG